MSQDLGNGITGIKVSELPDANALKNGDVIIVKQDGVLKATDYSNFKGVDGTNGTNGLSAYQIWLNAGNVGSQDDYLASLKGVNGDNGTDGINGTNGSNGQSAYQIWLSQGNVGTQADFLASLKGATGDPGGAGSAGDDGLSAYQIWVNAGNVGTEADFLASLKGSKGDPGIAGTNGTNGTNGANGQGVPVGGTAGQVLSKIDSTNYNTQWANPSGGTTIPPSATEKFVTQTSSGPQVNYSVANLIVSASALTSADWSTGTASVTGVPGQQSSDTNYMYYCFGINQWSRTAINTSRVNLFLAAINDSSGIKTSSQLNAVYPSAIIGQRAWGNNGYYEKTSLAWAYFAATMV